MHLAREPGGPVLALAHTKAASRSLRTHVDDGRAREVGPLRSTAELAEQRPGTDGGGGGGKGADQGEHARAQRAPDAEPGRRAQRARAGTASSQAGQATAVHGASPSCVRRGATARGLLRDEAGRGSRHRRRDMAALRDSLGGKSPGPLAAVDARGVSSEAGTSRVYPEGGRAAA